MSHANASISVNLHVISQDGIYRDMKILLSVTPFSFQTSVKTQPQIYFFQKKLTREDSIDARLGEFDPGYVDSSLLSVLAGTRPHGEPD